MSQLVLVRHGQSQWNLENRFTGWVDVPLTEKGEQEAQAAGQILKNNHLQFDWAYTSFLQRAIHTLWSILKETEQSWIPVQKDWRLNERHYGGLQGLNKQETRDKFGDNQVFEWRRSYSVAPPAATGPLQEAQIKDRRYAALGKQLPKGEALKHTLERVQPYWESHIKASLQKGSDASVLVVAHGNSLRALVKILTQMSEEEITSFEFETGVPLHMNLAPDFTVKSMDWLKS